MKLEDLKKLSEEKVISFIKQKKSNKFNMSGYEDITGKCTTHNLSILNEFAYLGIYDYTSYLFLDFHKGMPTLYFKYFYEDKNYEIDEWAGYGTSEIIYEIFKLTIFSNKRKRRRD